MKTIVVALAILLSTQTAYLLAADPVPLEEPRRLRTSNAAIARALETGYLRSATFRGLLRTISSSDLIVYIVENAHYRAAASGLMRFVIATSGTRYIRIEVDTHMPVVALTALIGHELQHAREVAGAPEIVDGESFRRFYRSNGEERCRARQYECYDTDEAVRAGWRVSQELTTAGAAWFPTP